MAGCLCHYKIDFIIHHNQSLLFNGLQLTKVDCNWLFSHNQPQLITVAVTFMCRKENNWKMVDRNVELIYIPNFETIAKSLYLLNLICKWTSVFFMLLFSTLWSVRNGITLLKCYLLVATCQHLVCLWKSWLVPDFKWFVPGHMQMGLEALQFPPISAFQKIWKRLSWCFKKNP